VFARRYNLMLKPGGRGRWYWSLVRRDGERACNGAGNFASAEEAEADARRHFGRFRGVKVGRLISGTLPQGGP